MTETEPKQPAVGSERCKCGGPRSNTLNDGERVCDACWAAADDSRKSPPAEREAFAAATGYAALARRVEGLRAQARRRRVRAGMDRDDFTECYYTGRIAALDDVMELLEAEQPAPHTGADERHSPAKGDL